MDNRRQVEALRAANRGMVRAVCQGAKTAKRYAALGAGMEVDAQGYGREPTAMVRGVLSYLFVCLFLTLMKLPCRNNGKPGKYPIGYFTKYSAIACHFSCHSVILSTLFSLSLLLEVNHSTR